MDYQYLYNTLVTSSLGCTGKLRYCLNFQPQVVQLLNILHNSIMVQEYIYRYIFQLQIVHLLDTLQNSIVLQKFPQNLIRQIQNQHQKGFKIVHPKTHYIMIQEFVPDFPQPCLPLRSKHFNVLVIKHSSSRPNTVVLTNKHICVPSE